MSYKVNKTEMGNKNGKSRWITRCEAKTGSKKVRRAREKKLIRAHLAR